MQDAKMLRLEIVQTLNFLPLEVLKKAAKYIALLYASVNNRKVEPAEIAATQSYNSNYHATVQEGQHMPTTMDWDAWCAKSNQLTKKILERRNGKFIDTDAIWDAVQADWEEHDNRFFSA